MKIILQDKEKYILRFDKGEEVVAGIVGFMKESGVQACSFTGLGSAAETEIGFYNPFLKEYRRKPFLEGAEIINVTGNGSFMQGEPAIHVHGLFGRTDFTVFGGHVFKLVVLATCEIHVLSLAGSMQRAKNEDFNLNLLN